MAAAIVLAWCPSALGAVSNPRASVSGNTLTLTWSESTTTYGLTWWLDGNAYAITSRSPGDCTEYSEHPGMICTFTSSGVTSVSMTTDKPVSPNTITHASFDSAPEDNGQAFDVLVGGTGPTPQPTATPTPTPTPTPDPEKKKKKDAAKADVDPAIATAMADCSIALGGAGLIGAGALGSVGAPFAGIPAAVAGTLMVDSEGPLCALALARLLLDARIIKDPPDTAFGTVALPGHAKHVRPASCRRVPKRGKAACGQIASKAAALAGAAARADAVRAAMSTTMNRASGAEAAGDAAGLALQDASHRVLAGMLARAIAVEHRSAVAFAKQLARDRIRIVLTGAKARKGAKLTLKRLARMGVPTAGVRAPKRIDLVAALRRRTPTKALVALAHGLTAAAAAGYLDVVAAQRHVTPAKARRQLRKAGAYLPR
jgi:hypothetical protein